MWHDSVVVFLIHQEVIHGQRVLVPACKELQPVKLFSIIFAAGTTPTPVSAYPRVMLSTMAARSARCLAMCVAMPPTRAVVAASGPRHGVLRTLHRNLTIHTA
mmetsp:Transcript_29721/g.85064  ORF Transcript_29721/g.85064 Transcript_29721/m.85064 type:complete len:103 (+) Transcript_29721:870-1178(+)